MNKVPRTVDRRRTLRYRAAASALRDYAAAFAQRTIEPPRPVRLHRRVQDVAAREPRPAADRGAALLRPRVDRRRRRRAAADAGRVACSSRPTFPQPMYEALRDLSPELLLPGVGTIEPTRSRCSTRNPRFIEAYMVGLNHELAVGAALARVPERHCAHTYFRTFWDTRGAPAPMPQLPPIREWSPAAGLGDSFGARRARSCC